MSSLATHINKWNKMTVLSIESEISEKGPTVGIDYLFNERFNYQIIDTDYEGFLIAYVCTEINDEEF